MYLIIEQMFNDTLKAMSETSIWIKWGAIALGGIFSFIAPVQSFIIAAMALVFVDVITGVWASKNRSEKFNSRRLYMTVSKLILYPLTILISNLVVVTFFKDIPVVDGLTYMVSLFLCMVEFQSNIENVGDIVNIDIWSNIKKWFADKIKINKDSNVPPVV